MRIEVVVSGWEQHCCGPAFTRGSETTVSIVAADPAQTERGAPARFLEEHHGQTPADVPQRDVTGTVVRISGATYERRRTPGPNPAFEIGSTLTSAGELEAVAARETAGFDELRLLLDVEDDVDLPSHVVSSETLAARDRAIRDQERADRRRHDDVGILLATIAQEAEGTYASAMTVERAEDGQSVTIDAPSPGSTGISWARYTTDEKDILVVQLGEGRFSFAADFENASDLRVLIAAVAAGRVRERVERGDESTLLETIVDSADGRTWTATTTEAPFRIGGDVVMMSGRLASRLRTGDHGYEPWSI